MLERRIDAQHVLRVVLAAAIGSFVLAALSGAAAAPSASAAAHAESAKGPVVFVPLGAFPRSDAQALARYVRGRAGLRTSVLGSGALPRSAFAPKRKQYVAEELISLLFPRRPAGGVVIGLVLEDMYARNDPFRFVFSLRHPQGVAVVSRIRMDPAKLGLTPDFALRIRRLQKMVQKQVGALALGQRLSRNPRSVMFDSVLGVDDLDYMTQEFRPAKPAGARRTWLARTTDVCKLGTSRQKALDAGAQVSTPDDFLAYLEESIALRDEFRSGLLAVPAARADRGDVRGLLARFKRAVDADRTALARLRNRWSEDGVRAWVLTHARHGLALKADALELGSLGCGRYFDPATYG